MQSLIHVCFSRKMLKSTQLFLWEQSIVGISEGWYVLTDSWNGRGVVCFDTVGTAEGWHVLTYSWNSRGVVCVDIQLEQQRGGMFWQIVGTAEGWYVLTYSRNSRCPYYTSSTSSSSSSPVSVTFTEHKVFLPVLTLTLYILFTLKTSNTRQSLI